MSPDPTRPVGQTQSAAGQVAEQAKHQATSQLESQKARAADSLGVVAQALRQTGQHLQHQQQSSVAGYVEQTAARLESMTNYLRSREVPELVADTKDLARRKPELFLTGALAIGFVGARFLKSSGQRAALQTGTSAPPAYPSQYPASPGPQTNRTAGNGAAERGLYTS
jgi:hypothetical protein